MQYSPYLCIHITYLYSKTFDCHSFIKHNYSLFLVWKSTASQSCGWGLITTHSCPHFWCSKKNSNSTQFIELSFGASEQIKPYNLLIRRQSSSLSPSSSPCWPVLLIWQSLQKAVWEDNQRILLQKINGQALGLLGLLSCTGWAVWTGKHKHSLAGSFLVCCSSCWQLPAHLRKLCYHSCKTDSVQQSHKGLMLCRYWPLE